MGLPACLSTLVPWEEVQMKKVDDAEAQGLALLCLQQKAVLHSRWLKWSAYVVYFRSFP